MSSNGPIRYRGGRQVRRSERSYLTLWVSLDSILHYNAASLLWEVSMRADQVEVSWDSDSSKWLIRVVSGEEVIRRHYDGPRTADEETLLAAARKTLQDEGYEFDGTKISIIL